MATESEVEQYIRAGEIACRAREEAERLVRAGVRVLDLAEVIEKMIRDLGGELAFPVNISIDNVAAHYTPLPDDSTVIGENAVVKIDIGVHVNGYIADTATTVVLSDVYRILAEAAQQALEKGLSVISVGRRFSDVGSVIDSVIRSYGFKPIYNLSGHRIDRYQIHAGETIPNFGDRLNLGKFRPGCVYAVEPFATNGSGFVVESNVVTIYALKYNPKKLMKISAEAGNFYSSVYSGRRSLPFAKRWYVKSYCERIDDILLELESKGLLTKYPVLIEKHNGIVTQFEHTVVISHRGEVIVTTNTC